MALTASILAVPGLGSTSPDFRRELWAMAYRNGWDVDAIATVMSIESGFRASIQNPQEGQTASGLIQFTDSTARGLGVPGGAAGIRAMSAVEQLPWVEKYYRRAFGNATPRMVDFYLAGWGSGIGKPDDHVLASRDDERKFNKGKDNLYTLNAGLDANGDGKITVADIAAKMHGQQAKAGGRRLEVATAAAPLAQPPAVGLGSSLPAQRSQSLSELCSSLPVVKLGSTGPAVRLLEWLLQVPSATGTVGPSTDQRLRLTQQQLAARRLYDGKIDGEIGPKSWRAILEWLAPIVEKG